MPFSLVAGPEHHAPDAGDSIVTKEEKRKENKLGGSWGTETGKREKFKLPRSGLVQRLMAGATETAGAVGTAAGTGAGTAPPGVE